MSSFLFDRDFDQELEAEARVPAPPAPAIVGPDPAALAGQLAAVREAAFAEGHAAGSAETEARLAETIDTEIAASLNALLPQIEALEAGLVRHRHHASQDLARMCLFLAERLLPEVLTQFGTRRIEAFCRRALRLAEGSAGAEIRLSPQMHAELHPVLGNLSTSSGAPLRLIADPALSNGTAEASWQSGRAEYAAEELHAELLATLSSIAQTPAPDGMQP